MSTHPIWRIGLFNKLSENAAECIECRENKAVKYEYKLFNGSAKSLVVHLKSGLHKDSDFSTQYDRLMESRKEMKDEGTSSQSYQKEDFLFSDEMAQQHSEWDLRDCVVEDRYPKRSRKNKIEDLSLIDEPEIYVNKAEKLSKLPYPIKQILGSAQYEHDDVVCALPIQEFTIEYIKRTGLLHPLFFNVPPEQLGMRMPNPDEFSVMDVLECVGSDRRIEVVEVYEQKGSYKLMKDFVEYYNKPPAERTQLLNVLSLEFTSTKLAEKVTAPAFVSEIDWIDNVWPKELFKRQEDLLQKSATARNNDFSTYPKVQRYCLMSVAKCFTDFHIDFGGTSVWYHILKGEKIFWLIEPTEANLQLYEDWILGGSENSCFFGQLVPRCARVKLSKGNTLVIPSGWIHCVYTPVDSLVFGGNFLHSYSIPMQIRVSRSEDRIKIGSKYRFPHFKQMFWCYIALIVRKATRRIYQNRLPEEAHIPVHQKPSEDQRTNDERKTSTSEAMPECILDTSEEEILVSENNDVKNESENIPISEAEARCKTADGEEICYDKSMGNAADGSLVYNPIQLKFDKFDSQEFIPPSDYDIDYLRSLSCLELNGIRSLFEYAKKLNKSKQPEVIEGITRPHHLVKELQGIIEKINEFELMHIQTELDLAPKRKLSSEMDANHWIVPGAKESVALTVRLPPKFEKKKMKRQAVVSETMQKKAQKKKGANLQSSVSGLVLVGGLPLPTHLNAHVSTGFSPIGDVVKLGQQSLQSAWRKGTKMLKPPTPSMVQQFKKPRLSDEQKCEELPFDQTVEIYGNESTTAPEMESDVGEMKQKRAAIPRIKKATLKATHHQLLEVHDESPEFVHRSPLQRIKPEVKSQTTSNPPPAPTPTFASSAYHKNDGPFKTSADWGTSSSAGWDGAQSNKNFNNSSSSTAGWGGDADRKTSNFNKPGNNSGFDRNKNNNNHFNNSSKWNANNNGASNFNNSCFNGDRHNESNNSGGFNGNNKNGLNNWSANNTTFNSRNNNFNNNNSGNSAGFNRKGNWQSQGKFGGWNNSQNNNNDNGHWRRPDQSWNSQSQNQQQSWNRESQQSRRWTEDSWKSATPNTGNDQQQRQQQDESFDQQQSFDSSGGCFQSSFANTSTSNSFNTPTTTYESPENDINKRTSFVTTVGQSPMLGQPSSADASSSYSYNTNSSPPSLVQQQQPFSSTVNELHHISQMMELPGYAFDLNLDDIPLPSEPQIPKDSRDSAGSTMDDDQQTPGSSSANSDPFAEVDQLAQISEEMTMDEE